jgi:TIR domain
VERRGPLQYAKMEGTATPRLIFISYEDVTGRPLAVAVRAALLEEGVSGWVWAIDHPDGYVFSEIAKRISEADYICWVCTAGTIASEGQEWEIENAFGQRKLKRSWVIALEAHHVPPSLKGYYRHEATPETVSAVVKDWLSHCRRGFPDWPTPVSAVADVTKSEAEDIAVAALVDPP